MSQTEAYPPGPPSAGVDDSTTEVCADATPGQPTLISMADTTATTRRTQRAGASSG